jgi:hypothetical protein
MERGLREEGRCAMSERETAMANLDEALRKGLVDVKLFVPAAKSLSEEELFAAMNRIDAALAAGKCDAHDMWPHDVEPKPFGPLMD